jgi:pilus assembly protein Flp/PilA
VGENQPFSRFARGAAVPDSSVTSFGEEVTLLMLMNLIHRLRQRDEEGQALVEYALILGLIAVVAITSLTVLGTNVDGVLSYIASKVGTAIP